MTYITEATLRHHDDTRSSDPHRCDQFPGSPDAHARRLRWQAMPPHQQAEQEEPLTQAEQDEWDRLTALFQSRQAHRRAQSRSLSRALKGESK